jgi:hypothetical protein
MYIESLSGPMVSVVETATGSQSGMADRQSVQRSKMSSTAADAASADIRLVGGGGTDVVDGDSSVVGGVVEDVVGGAPVVVGVSLVRVVAVVDVSATDVAGATSVVVGAALVDGLAPVGADVVSAAVGSSSPLHAEPTTTAAIAAQARTERAFPDPPLDRLLVGTCVLIITVLSARPP